MARNEHSAINVCHGYIQAQRQYWLKDRSGRGVLQYAQRLMSTPGRKDGLYWETKPGAEPSPLSCLVAKAGLEMRRPKGKTADDPNSPAPCYSFKAKLAGEPTPSRHIRRQLAIAVAAFSMLIIGGSSADELPLPSTRPFRMGFTLWPADLSVDGIRTSQSFAYSHGDMISVMFIGGIPWPEAFEGKPFSKDVQSNLNYRPPSGSKLFLSISPLNRDRSDIAPYWGGEKTTCRFPSHGIGGP
jgi:hypothetical protein